jgi:hypothetical protein
MAFPWLVAQHAPFASGHLAEDVQLGLQLAQKGTPPVFCETAFVGSVFAASAEGEKSQRTRWEHGKLSLLVHEGPGLIWSSISQRKWGQLLMTMDLLIPPLALLLFAQLALALVIAVLMPLLNVTLPLTLVALGVLMQTLAILLARSFYAEDLIKSTELMLVPLYVLRKLGIYARFVFKRETQWVRTKRDQ